jgi:diaminohydroxyphosphoribosylaminopyrimidine deaminase/5-amino-6-(5-phosphoribosylamino)uracil reductase
LHQERDDEKRHVVSTPNPSSLKDVRQLNPNPKFMRAAIKEAQKGVGNTSPNPAVGAVLVANGKIISRGYHSRAGSPHAEINCLERVKYRPPSGAILYVTLEPCATTGRTGPCTDAIIHAGIQCVVIGAVDPNPKQSGRGTRLLREANINVQIGVLAEECAQLNEAYNKWVTTGYPFVIAKCGMSLDGRLSMPPGKARWITSEASRRDVQRIRAQVDAVMVGANTLRVDNPRLTVRGIRGAKQPWRIILSRSGTLPKNLRVFEDRFSSRTLVCNSKSLKATLQNLGEKEITSVLIEGGGTILGHALDKRLVDKIHLYLGPVLTGGAIVAFAGRGAGSTREGAKLTRIEYKRIGSDISIVGYPSYE